MSAGKMRCTAILASLVFAAACDDVIVGADGGFEEFVPDSGPAVDSGPVVDLDAGPADAGPQFIVKVVQVLPASGPTSGGTHVILTGASFANNIGDPGSSFLKSKTTIRFGGNPALDFRVVDDDTIEVVSPTGLSGLQDVEVQNPNGTGVCADCFRFYEPVVLRSVTPNRGPTTGGTPVVLVGSGFENGVQVLFGTRAAASVRVVSPTRIEAFAPPAAGTGAVDVAVAGKGGVWSLRRSFIYFDTVRVDAALPAVGPLAGGNTIVVRGAGFTPSSIVFVGALACLDPDYNADATLSCVAPAGAAVGPADVTVRTVGVGEATLAGGYSYADPDFHGFVLYAVVPRRGPATGGNFVTLTGQGFQSGSFGASIGGSVAPLVRIDSDWQATLTAPAGTAGLVDVQARADLGGAVLSGAYRYDAPVLISRVTPDNAPASGLPVVTVRIAGTGFHGAADTVTVGGLDATVVSDTTTEIVIFAPGGGEGATFVVVRSPAPDGFLREGRAPFRFTAPLSLLQIDPTTAAISGGQLATVFGSGFTATTQVRFGAAAGVHAGAVTPNKLTVRVPPGEEGAVDVVAQEGSDTDVLPQGFTYYDPTAPSGGLSGGPMQGTLNVVVLELDQDRNAWPVPDARVFVGSTNPLAANTDARGMVTFSDSILVKSVSVTVSKSGYESTTVEAVASRNLTVFVNRNEGGGPPAPPTPQPGPPPASMSGRIYGFKKDPARTLTMTPNERWVARVYHAPPAVNWAPPYLNDLVEAFDPFNPFKEYGVLGYKTVSRDGGAYEFPVTFYGAHSMYAMYGVEDTDTLEFEPYLMGIRQGVEGKPGVTAEGQDIILSMHLDQNIPMKVEQPLVYQPGPVWYITYAYIDLGGEGVIPIATRGVNGDSPAAASMLPAYPILFDYGSQHTLTRMPPVPGENLIFWVWAWSGEVSGGYMDYPITFAWRRQPGDLTEGLTVGPLLGLSTAVEPINDAVFNGRIAWQDTSGGMPPDLALVQLEEPIFTLFGIQWKPWLTAVAPGGQSSVNVPLEAIAAYFPPATFMRWTLITAREPRLNYDSFTYNDVFGRGWTSYSVEQDWTLTP